MPKKRRPTVLKLELPPHPGEILARMLEERRIRVNALGVAIGVDPMRIHRIVKQLISVTPDTALRLGIYFQMDPMEWLRWQAEHDVAVLNAAFGEQLRGTIKPPPREDE